MNWEDARAFAQCAVSEMHGGFSALRNDCTMNVGVRVAPHPHSPALARNMAAMSPFRELADAGGLISYGANLSALYTRAADFVDRIAKGTKPADLPVEQPVKFEMVLNLKTAQALGLTIPVSIIARADEVIE